MSRILNLYSQLLKDKERFVDEVFEAEIYKQARPQLIVVDIGAYQGEFGFYCLPFSKKVYAIEPDPKPYAMLKKYIRTFELEDRIVPFPVAIAGKGGVRKLHASGGGGSSLLEPDAESDKQVKVRALTLNEFFKENNLDHINILKIDCEGSEKEILEALDIDLALGKVDLVIGEDHGYETLIGEVLERNRLIVTYEGPVFIGKR